MKKYFFTFFIAAAFLFSGNLYAEQDSKIQLAILLDTSNSMDGLINQARTHIWRIVNELNRLKKNGRHAVLEVALYEYGNDYIPRSQGHIRQVAAFTGDLDLISEKLFSLRTNGGDEFCGQVIDTALKNLRWSDSKSDLKLIMIAGNEPFTQGYFDYRNAVSLANRMGVIVNTVFCGSMEEGIRTGWKNGSDLACGRFVNIDHNSNHCEMDTPYDRTILDLGNRLNSTYVPYGYDGELKRGRQAAQDKMAEESAPAAGINRSVAKSSASYNSSSWDMVDAYEKGGLKLESLKKSDMPSSMSNYSKSDVEKYVKGKSVERKKIQKEIENLNVKRRKYLDSKQKKNETDTFDSAVIKIIQDQAKDKKFNIN
jgi:hypothetical protein